MDSQDNRKRILFFAETVTLAHMARCLKLAKELHEYQGYEITIAADERYDDIIESVPFRRIHLNSISSQLFSERIAKGLPIYNVETLTDYVNEDVEIIDAVMPDFIIGDFRLSLAISCRLKKVPYATITNAYWSPFADIEFPVPELPINKFLGVVIAQKIFDIVRPFVFWRHVSAFNKVCKKFGQPGVSKDLRAMYTDADYTLYADIESFVPMQTLPENHIFIGPVLWSANVSLPEWWEHLPDDKPVIFVTLGSSGESALLPMILEALSHLSVTVVCATANKTRLDVIYSNVYVSEFLPVESIVKRSDIVICNGGSPMVYQSIVEKKFVIGIPSNLDQYLMMNLAEKAGVGCLLRAGVVNSEIIKKTVSEALVSNQGRLVSFVECMLKMNKVVALINDSLLEKH